MAQSWFIMRGESRLGPFTHHGLVSLASNGGLSRDDMVWCSDFPAPIPAVGVAGLFPEADPAPAYEPGPEPEPEPEPDPEPVSTPFREFRPPPRPGLTPPAQFRKALSGPKTGRFASLFEDDGDVSLEDQDEPDEDEEIAIPVVRRATRRVAPARKRTDHSSLLIALGALALLAVIMLIVVLEQNDPAPPRPRPTVKPNVRSTSPGTSSPSAPRSQPTAPQAVTQPPPPAPPPPPPPRFDKQPLIDEMTKATVDAIFQSQPSVKSRFRSLWESQLSTLLAQETKGMREEGEVRAVAKRVCDAWSAETLRFVTQESAPPPPPDAIDGASQVPPEGEAPGEPDAQTVPPNEPE